jgi:putative membrane protein
VKGFDLNFMFRWATTALAVAAAAYFVPGIHVDSGSAWVAVVITAGILALLNITVKPILKVLTGCLLILTLGLFTLVINAGLLYASAWVSSTWFLVPYTIDGFWPALLGGLVVSLASIVLSLLTGKNTA